MISLSLAEIIDLARFTGLDIDDSGIDRDDLELTEITIAECPLDGLRGDSDEVKRYRHIAYYSEYPDEGATGLGPELIAENT